MDVVFIRPRAEWFWCGQIHYEGHCKGPEHQDFFGPWNCIEHFCQFIFYHHALHIIRFILLITFLLMPLSYFLTLFHRKRTVFTWAPGWTPHIHAASFWAAEFSAAPNVQPLVNGPPSMSSPGDPAASCDRPRRQAGPDWVACAPPTAGPSWCLGAWGSGFAASRRAQALNGR